LTEDERKKLVVLLHKGTVGEWNFDALANSFDVDNLLEWGFDEKELDLSLWGMPAQGDAEPQFDRAEELREIWGVQLGDLWQLGEHRLACGDCTDAAVVERVMGGEKADMVFTDPPYNVAENSCNYARDCKSGRKTYETLANADWDKGFVFNDFGDVLLQFLALDCVVYVCTSQWLVGDILKWMWSWSDFFSYCVWCKPNPMPSLSKRHWTWATELIPYAVRGKHVANFPETGNAHNFWIVNRETHRNDHPTEKPVEIPTTAIKFSSVENSIVFDGFLGSGTTIIACENLKRKCRAIEISPQYVSVAIQRFADAFPSIEIKKISP
jgi:DNA modification methylase